MQTDERKRRTGKDKTVVITTTGIYSLWLVVTQFYAGCLYENSVLNKGIFNSIEYKENTAAW